MNLISNWRGLSSTGTALLALLLCSPAIAAGDLPFRITVDGQQVDGTHVASTPSVEKKPGLEAADIQIKFDGLSIRPILNVSTIPPKPSFQAGETVRFLGSFNYGAWIDRAEVLIYESGRRNDNGVIATLDVSSLGAAEWVMPDTGPVALEYVLRVYDTEGRFDETYPLPLNRKRNGVANAELEGRAIAPGYSEDRTAVRNINVFGGAVTAYGKNIPADHEVTILGEPVPLDGNGSFVAQRLLPPGTHGVEVSVLKNGVGLEFTRDVTVPENEWFTVALADFTGGYRFNRTIEAVRPGEFSKTYTKGRLAFYLKGKMKGRYILTAAADTGEQKLRNIFAGLDEKDPRAFLKRIDPDDYYPVYGDDSEAFEDAPTRGKFYLRLDRGSSHIMWGNFKSNITGTKFLRNERALYGASGVFRSEETAPNGEARTAADVYAAQPGTVPQRDVLRGTGGSAYFLKHQDITQGSETVSVEVRNPTTGWVVERKTLKYNADYEFDYVQGVIILRKPLSSSAGSGAENYLVVAYEFTPAAGDIDGYVAGGRAQQWIGDHVRVGVSGMREKTQNANQTMYGADVRIEKNAETYIEAEVARSKGPGFGTSYSPDGGLSTVDNPTAGVAGRTTNAYRVEARVALEDISNGAVQGKIQARYEHFQRGFASLETQANERKTLWGVEVDAKLSDRVIVAATYSDAKSGASQSDREGRIKANVKLNETVSIEPYAAYVERKGPTASTGKSGDRTVAGVRLIYSWDENNEAYVFGQGTVSRSGELGKDNRVGVGGKKAITDRVGMSGEISTGSTGFAADALINYEPADSVRYYLGYRLEAEHDGASSWPFALVGDDNGTIVVGAQHQVNEHWELYGEDNYDMFGNRRSLTQTYGVKYSPDDSWTIGGGVEIGTVHDNTIDTATGRKNPDFDRNAASFSIGYHDEAGVDARVKAEARFENSDDDQRDLDSYLIAADVGIKVSEDWRTLGTLDAVFTDATDAIKEGNYAEGSIGFAYRPATSDKLNALVKYTYLYDNPGLSQVTVDGTTDGPSQRSHIFSADVSYDVLPQLTIGAKYGFRLGESKDRTVGSGWEESNAHLAIARADIHIVHQWDALLEGRVLWSPTTNQADYALLVALYRQIGDNFKVGVGYNFGQFSDDLRDLTLDDQGVFVNIVGKI